MSKCECKECLHYEVCDKQKIINHTISKSVCKHYKAKSLFVELPCKVGDNKFVESKIKGKVLPCEINGFFINKNILIDVIFDEGTDSFWFEQVFVNEIFETEEGCKNATCSD